MQSFSWEFVRDAHQKCIACHVAKVDNCNHFPENGFRTVWHIGI